jgi:hypothetical protein
VWALKPEEIVQSWSHFVHHGEFDKARPLAAEHFAFRGPIDTFNRVDDYLAALKTLGNIVTGSEPEGVVAQGDQVALFYILKTKVADAPVAEWYTLNDGKISSIRVYFDARPFAPPSQAGSHVAADPSRV